MKRPTAASLKKVTPENLTALGAERLAEILVAVAQTRPELKRRLRMELAAEQGAEHLSTEIDKRLGSLAASRSKVSWRQRPTFVRDLDALRGLIVDRLAALDAIGALERMWLFMALAKPVGGRVRDKDGSLAAVFERAAQDLGAMLNRIDPPEAAARLAEAVARQPAAWSAWLPVVTADFTPALAELTLKAMAGREESGPGWPTAIRTLADAAGHVDAYRATFTADALRTPQIAAEVGRRLLDAGRVDEAGEVLQGVKAGRGAPDWDWESAWIDWLEQSGQAQAAQDARWASFERTLSVDRARAFTKRLGDFDDVEAEQRAFAYAAQALDFAGGLRFLMDWPALPEAARMIQARARESDLATEEAELWAARLRGRFPDAALALLRRAAAVAFRRREFAASKRLTEEADALGGEAA